VRAHVKEYLLEKDKHIGLITQDSDGISYVVSGSEDKKDVYLAMRCICWE
jgi:hypothetical protein